MNIIIMSRQAVLAQLGIQAVILNTGCGEVQKDMS